MPSKIRKALGAVKDQTSISLAKVSGTNFSNLYVAILKATSHEEVPVAEHLVAEVVFLTSSSRSSAAASVHYLARRIKRTHNWVVALKSLTLVHHILQQDDPNFTYETLRAMSKGTHLLNLSNFRDDSSSSPGDYTAFIRTFALYLKERLECFLMGKPQSETKSIYVQRQQQPQQRRSLAIIQATKLTVVLDKIAYWQRLLDRLLATKPTGPAKTNRLVQACLYSVVRDGFNLYRDISDGLTLILNNFFHLRRHSCAEAFHVCVRASKQFDELAIYYTLLSRLGIGRACEYPTLQKISDTLLETLSEFVKENQPQHHPDHERAASLNEMANLKTVGSGKDIVVHLSTPENGTEASTATEMGEARKLGFKSKSPWEGRYGGEKGVTEPASEQQRVEFGWIDVNETNASFSSSTQQDGHTLFDILQTGLTWPPPSVQEQQQQQLEPACSMGGGTGWEVALVESASNLANKDSNLFDCTGVEGWNEQGSPRHHYNPFLQGEKGDEIQPDFAQAASPVSFAPPTFCAQNPHQPSTIPPEEDPFSSSYCISSQTV